MLQQQPVRASLNELMLTKKMKVKHTLGYDQLSVTPLQTPYRPILAPAEKRQQIASTLEKTLYRYAAIKSTL